MEQLHGHLQHLLLMLLNGGCICGAWQAKLAEVIVQRDAFYKPALDLQGQRQSSAAVQSGSSTHMCCLTASLVKRAYSIIMRASPSGKKMTSSNITTRGMLQRLAYHRLLTSLSSRNGKSIRCNGLRRLTANTDPDAQAIRLQEGSNTGGAVPCSCPAWVSQLTFPRQMTHHLVPAD